MLMPGQLGTSLLSFLLLMFGFLMEVNAADNDYIAPVVEPVSVESNVGENATFACHHHNPDIAVVIAWNFCPTTQQEDDTNCDQLSGQEGEELILTNIQLTDEGRYFCAVTPEQHRPQISSSSHLRVLPVVEKVEEEGGVGIPLFAIKILIILGTVATMFLVFVVFVFKVRKYVDWFNRAIECCRCYKLENIGRSRRRRSCSHHQVLKYPYDKLRILRPIGNGEYGKVYMAEAPGLRGSDDGGGDDGTSCIVALKSCAATAPPSEETTQSANVMKEAETLASLSHPNIVRLLAVSCATKRRFASFLFGNRSPRIVVAHGNCSDTIATLQPPFLLFEYVDNGDLCTYLRTHGKHKDLFVGTNDCESKQINSSSAAPVLLSLPARLSFCAQIAAGMEYLSDRHIVHRDLAARNCLLTRSGRVKISDFGLSRDTNHLDSYSYTTRGIDALPVRWMAPEAFLDGLYSSASDVWSFGVVIWEIFTDAVQPFFGIPNHQVITSVLQGRLLSKPRLAPDWLYEVMLVCWNSAADKRPTFTELDVFFRKLQPAVMPTRVETSNRTFHI